MTVIIAYKEGGRVYCAADTGATAENWGMKFEGQQKIWRKEVLHAPPMLVGAGGSLRVAQFLRYDFEWPPYDHDDPMAYIAGPFATALSHALSEAGHLKIEGSETKSNFEIILGALHREQPRLFRIDSALGVYESDRPYAVIGCAEDVSNGVLWALRDAEMPPERRLTAALDGACYFNAFVRPPYTFLSLPE